MVCLLLLISCHGQGNKDQREIEQRFITIIEKGEVKSCKMELLTQKNDTSIYIKTVELSIKHDSEYNFIYLASSVVYGYSILDQMHIKCEYMLIHSRQGYILELTEDQIDELPGLSRYLSDKIKKQKLTETQHGYITM